MLLALQDVGKAGKVTFIGFDTSETFTEAMGKQQLHGIVVQNPFNMGYLGVRTMVEHLQGKGIEKRLDTGVTMVTPDNLAAAEIQTLLHPPIEQYQMITNPIANCRLADGNEEFRRMRK